MLNVKHFIFILAPKVKNKLNVIIYLSACIYQTKKKQKINRKSQVFNHIFAVWREIKWIKYSNFKSEHKSCYVSRLIPHSWLLRWCSVLFRQTVCAFVYLLTRHIEHCTMLPKHYRDNRSKPECGLGDSHNVICFSI